MKDHEQPVDRNPQCQDMKDGGYLAYQCSKCDLLFCIECQSELDDRLAKVEIKTLGGYVCQSCIPPEYLRLIPD